MPPISTPADAPPPARPAFRDGQTLRAADLRAEAADRIRAAHRHQSAAHSPGVVAGLWLTVTGKKLSVGPGAAVDAKGRMILVPNDDDSQLPELPDKQQFPIEVWLAYRGDPEDADGTSQPEDPPDRSTDRFDVLLARPGEIVSDDPRCPVFLGAIFQGKSDHSQREYVGAVGARVEAASRQVRLLLGPDGPDDSRIFAIGTRTGPRDSYADHVTADAVDSLTLAAPVLVTGGGKGTIAVVVAGDRPPVFAAEDVLDPAAMLRRWDRVVALRGVLADHVEPALILADPGPEAEAQLKATVASALNRIVNGVGGGPRGGGPPTDRLIEAVRQAGVVPSGATVQQLSARATRAPRVDEPLLRRLLLDDAFAGLVSPFSDADPGPVRGVSFAGVAAPPTLARPGGVYLAEVTDKAGTRRELRIEFRDPGKEQHPDRYKVRIGTVANQAPPQGKGESAFTAALTVAADKTVTIAGNLDVFTSDGQAGLILKVTPTADPNDPAVQAAQLGLVSPDDLLLHKDPHPQVVGDGVQLSTDAQLVNKGQAPMVGVQLHATLFPTNNTDQEPITVTLLRGLTLKAGQASALVSPVDGKSPLIVPLRAPEADGPDFSGLPANTELTLILKALGAGPGKVVAQVARRMKFINRTH